MTQKSIQETFRDIVGVTAQRVLPTVNELLTVSEGTAYNLTDINYIYGHSTEVSGIMEMIAQDPTFRLTQFPLVWLEEDIKYGVRDDLQTVIIKRLVIAWVSEHKYESQERENHSFVPVLRPIYEELVRQIERSKRFWIYDARKDMRHDVFDRKYWGTDDAAKTVFSDYIDAIEINNIEIKLTPNNCS